MNPTNDLYSPDRLLSILENQTRASAETAIAQREVLEHLKDLHERSREQGVVMKGLAEHMERGDSAIEQLGEDIRGEAAKVRVELGVATEQMRKHVSTEVLVAALKISGGLKLLAIVCGVVGPLIAAAIGFAAVWHHG